MVLNCSNITSTLFLHFKQKLSC